MLFAQHHALKKIGGGSGGLGDLGCCPVSGWVIHLDSDYETVVLVRLAMNYAGAGIEIPADRANRQLLLGPPTSPRQKPCPVATDVNGGSDFSRRTIRAAQLHKHLQRDSLFFSSW